jgi:hypothetical protein
MRRLVIVITGTVLLLAAYDPTDTERAGWTMGDMNSWRIALSAFQQDNGKFPDVRTLQEARDAIQPKYIAYAPMHDAWGNPYRYELDGKGGFRLVSAGADGKFQPEGWSEKGRTKDLNADAVATAEGRWLQRSWQVR